MISTSFAQGQAVWCCPGWLTLEEIISPSPVFIGLCSPGRPVAIAITKLASQNRGFGVEWMGEGPLDTTVHHSDVG